MTSKFYHDGDTRESLFFLGVRIFFPGIVSPSTNLIVFPAYPLGSIGVVLITLVVVALHCLSDEIKENIHSASYAAAHAFPSLSKLIGNLSIIFISPVLSKPNRASG
ncbi:hypothetical protein BDR05DRAFT_382506 [Suillus weaverae]|nr:hypothetical protein BDR05DRAFT_382506 [Suillus weaverae]